MLSVETIDTLRSGGLKPGRTYDGFKASSCARALASDKGAVVATPNGIMVTDIKGMADHLRDLGFVCVQVAAFDRTTIAEAVEEAASIAVQRGLRWVMGR